MLIFRYFCINKQYRLAFLIIELHLTDSMLTIFKYDVWDLVFSFHTDLQYQHLCLRNLSMFL